MAVQINAPDVGEEEAGAAAAALRSGVLTSADPGGGPEVRRFERAVAAFAGARHAVAVSSGTAALQAALHAAGVGPGDDVLVPSFTFVATASAVRSLGARPVFVDVSRGDGTMDPADLAARATPASKAVVPVHVHGRAARMPEILEAASGAGLRVVEDAAQALGTRLGGRGAGTFGDAGCFSFYPGKVATTGEGGAVVTDSAEVRDAVASFRNHGIGPGGPASHGLNLRMPEPAAAVGSVQMRRLPGFLARRAANAAALTPMLSGCAAEAPAPRAGEEPNWSLYCVGVDGRDGALAALRARGVGAAAYYPVPVHRMPHYAAEAPAGGLPETDRAAARCLCVPVHPGVPREALEEAAAALRGHAPAR